VTGGEHLGPGRRLGRFTIERRLGGGGMGEVYAAREDVLDRRVALKVIAPRHAHDPEFRSRFVREAQAMARLDSAHVLPVHAHGEADGQLYLVTQLVPEGDLGRLLRERGVPPRGTALALMAQVAAGLADAHAAGLVHRDIKPANVLVRQRGDDLHAYLADFGIARSGRGDDRDRAASATTTVGTPAYLAPELDAGADPGPRSDVYSLGCLLWATLTGGPPYRAATDAALAAAHRERPVPQLDTDPASEQTRAVNRILRTALAKDPADRYASAAAMRDDLRRAAAQPNRPTIQPAQPARSVRPAVRRARAALAPALAATALAGGLLAVGLPGTGDERADPGPGVPAPTRATGPEEGVREWLAAMPGFDGADVTCDGQEDADAAGVRHCTVAVGADRGWVRVATADGRPAYSPELPPAEVALLVEEQYAEHRPRVSCPRHLPGRVGARLACSARPAPVGPRVVVRVTRVRALEVSFAISAGLSRVQ
jgi:serine/threonine-protein kinase